MMMAPNNVEQPPTKSNTLQDMNIDARIEMDVYVEGDQEMGAQAFDSQTRESSNVNSFHLMLSNLRASNTFVDKTSSISDEDKECVVCKTSNVPVCHLNLLQLENLKNSTKKLLCILEDVQAKTHSTALVPDDPPKMSDTLKPLTIWDSDKCDFMDRSVTDIIGSAAMRRLEKQAKDLDAIVIQDEDHDCSVYKRLSRKCHCLNQQQYNDFVIHFNEDTRFCTNTIGEIIKNMRILKKFLYMGGEYSKNALLFLNQGLSEGSHAEKAEIIQACAFADLCCIFDAHTIVSECIAWPCKNSGFIDPATQDMAAELLYNMAKLEEGRRYLNFNSKITCEIKKVIKKKQDKINYDTVEMLNSVLNLCQPSNQQFGSNTLSYHCRPMQEDMGNKTLNALIAYRQFMTVNELFMHLDILLSLSGNNDTKLELTSNLPSMLSLFKNMLLEFNNCDMNLIITNIMSNIVGKNIVKENERRAITVGNKLTSCIATEPIKKKNVTIQVPIPPRKSQKKSNGSRHFRHPRGPVTITKATRPNKAQQPSTQKVLNSTQEIVVNSISNNMKRKLNSISNAVRPKSSPNADTGMKWPPSIQQLNGNNISFQKSASMVFTATVGRSKKFLGGDLGNRTVIVVPREENNKEIQ